jgi:hypothetical protein
MGGLPPYFVKTIPKGRGKFPTSPFALKILPARDTKPLRPIRAGLCDPALTAVLVIVTGIIGAVESPNLRTGWNRFFAGITEISSEVFNAVAH